MLLIFFFCSINQKEGKNNNRFGFFWFLRSYPQFEQATRLQLIYKILPEYKFTVGQKFYSRDITAIYF